MEKFEEVIDNPALAETHRADAAEFFADWETTDYIPAKTHTGTPCNRYIVRQPDGHRDVDDFDDGGYVFAAFGFRKHLGGQFESKQAPFDVYGHPVYAYTPDFRTPYETDLFGVTVPGVYTFELLDHYQQKLTLVGVAHLHMHAPDSNGAGVLAFNPDGALRYVELRSGNESNLAAAHDLVQLHENRMVVKLGGRYASLRQNVGPGEQFGVPLWSFSEDTSLAIDINDTVTEPYLEHELPEDEPRHGRPAERHRFNMRRIARQLNLPAAGSGSYELDPKIRVDSVITGDSTVKAEWDGGTYAVELANREDPDRTVRYAGRLGVWDELEAAIPQTRLEISHDHVPRISDVFIFSKMAYGIGHRVLAARKDGGGIDITAL
jgi:hypothetical protein